MWFHIKRNTILFFSPILAVLVITVASYPVL